MLFALSAVALWFQVGTTTEDPHAIVRESIRAVEGDSAPAVVARWRARVDRNSSDRAAILGMATIARLTYDYVAARRWYEQLRPAVEVASQMDIFVPYYTLGLGEAYAAQSGGRPVPSFFENAAAFGRQVGDRRVETRALLLLASAAVATGKFSLATARLQQATRVLPNEARDLVALRLCVRATLLSATRDRRARFEADAGAALARSLGERRLEATCLLTLARDHFQAGDVPGAGANIAKAAALQRAARDRAGLATTQQFGAFVLYSVSSYGLAQQYLAEARTEAEASGNNLALAGTLLLLGRLAQQIGDAAEGAAFAERAQELYEGLADRAGLAEVHLLRGHLAFDAGDREEGRRFFRLSIESAEVSPDPLTAYLAHTRRASLAMWEDRPESAAVALRAARDMARRNAMWGFERGLAQSFAIVALRRGALDEADSVLRQLTDTSRREQPIRVYFGRVLRAEWFARRGELDSAAVLLRDASDRLDRWRASLNDANLRLQAYQVVPQLGDRDLGLATILASLARGGRLDEAFHFAERRRARELNDRLSAADLTRSSRDTSGTRVERARLLEGNTRISAVAAALPDERTALLEFVTGRGGEPTTLFVVTRRGATAHLVPPIDSLATDIAALGDLLEAGSDARAVARRLGDALFARVLSELSPAVTRFVIVPDDLLHRVPFDVLTAGDGQPLVRRFAISVAPSATVALSLWKRDPPRGEPRVLAMGDAAFVGETDASRASTATAYRDAFGASGGLPRLPASGGEARVAARHARRAEVLVREQASEAYLKRQPLESFTVLHLATHALVDDRSMARTALALAPADGEDGFLSPGDLAALRLDASLVVLSACRTARGVTVRGEGVHGLTAPLLAAGARSVLATQWRIDDRGAARFSADFYRALARGETVGDAARTAKLAAIDRGEQARIWAAFLVVGDPFVRIPLRVPVPWGSLGGGLAAMIVGGAMFYGIRTRKRRAIDLDSDPSASRAESVQ